MFRAGFNFTRGDIVMNLVSEIVKTVIANNTSDETKEKPLYYLLTGWCPVVCNGRNLDNDGAAVGSGRTEFR